MWIPAVQRQRRSQQDSITKGTAAADFKALLADLMAKGVASGPVTALKDALSSVPQKPLAWLLMSTGLLRWQTMARSTASFTSVAIRRKISSSNVAARRVLAVAMSKLESWYLKNYGKWERQRHLLALPSFLLHPQHLLAVCPLHPRIQGSITKGTAAADFRTLLADLMADFMTVSCPLPGTKGVSMHAEKIVLRWM
jgi:hypothetical protein